MSWAKKRLSNLGSSLKDRTKNIVRRGKSAWDNLRSGDLKGFGSDLLSLGWEATDLVTGGTLTVLGNALKRALMPDIPRPDYEDRKTMTRDTDTPYRVIYGRARVGAAVRYIESSGTDSNTLHIICVFAAHSCEAIERIYFNNELAFIGTTAQGKFAGKAVAILEHGKQTGANAQIVAQTPAGWTSEHKLLGMTYAYIRLTYDNDVYQGAPSISALIKGKDDVLDPRSNAIGWTDNQALCVMDWLRNDYGYGLSLSEIDTATFASGADVCDELVVSGVGTTEKRYTVNGAFSVIGQPQDALDYLSAAGLSLCQYVQGKVRYIAGNYTAPAVEASFDEDEIWSSVQVIPTTGANDRFNIVRGSYLDPAQEYEPVDFVPVVIQQYIDIDKQELAQDAKFPMTTSGTMARRIAKIMLERSRFGVRANCTLSWKAFEYSVGDRIKMTIGGLGWSDKVFRIDKMQYSLEGVQVELSEDAPAVWAWTEGDALVITPPPALNLPNTTPLAPPSNLQLHELLNTPRTENQDRVTIVLSSDAPADPRYNVTEYSYRVKDSAGAWVPINYSDGDVSVDLKADGTTYLFRARSVSLNGRVYESAIESEYTVYNRRLIGAVTPDVELPAVAGLRLTNNVDGTFDEYKSGNAEFEWQPRSETESVGFAEDELGADSGQFDLHFDDYRVTVFRQDGSVALQDATRDPWYVLTLETNRKFNVGRAFKLGVEARGANGQVGKGQTISVNNPAPLAVSDVSVAYTSEDITISYTLPDDLDFVGVRAGGKLYSGNSITLAPITARSVSLSLVSVDRFGDGATATVTLTNAAPAAPSDVAVTGGAGSFVVTFTPPANDYDYQHTRLRWRELGATDWLGTRIVTGSSATVLGLASNTAYEVELTSFDTLGAGGVATANVSTTEIVAADISGLGDWATLTDPADLDFIQQNVANNAIQSDKIASLVAGKITAGAIAVQVDVGDGANRVVLDGESGIVQTVGGGVDYKVTMGVHSVPSQSGAPLVLSASDGAAYNMWIDSFGNGRFGALNLNGDGSLNSNNFLIDQFGNATFGGELNAATGNITNVNAQNLVISGTSRFTAEAPPVFTVGTGGDFATLQEAVNHAQGFLGTGSTPTVAQPFAVAVRVLAGTVMNDSQRLQLQGRDYSAMAILFEDENVTFSQLNNHFIEGANCNMPSLGVAGSGDLTFTIDILANNSHLIKLTESRMVFSSSLIVDGVVGTSPNPVVRLEASSFIFEQNNFTFRPTLSNGYVGIFMTLSSVITVNELKFENSNCIAILCDLGRNFIKAYDQVIGGFGSGRRVQTSKIQSDIFSKEAALTIEGKMAIDPTLESGPINVIGNVILAAGTSAFNPQVVSLATFASYSDIANELDYPIGSILGVFRNNANVARNVRATIRLDTGNNGAFILGGSGQQLRGTWASRGIIGAHALFQRVS